MKPIPFLLATCALSGAPLLAAPTAPPAAPVAPPAAPVAAPIVAPQIDAKAVALLDQTVQAYAALGKLSQNFTINDSKDGEVRAGGSGNGTLMFQKPGNARVEIQIGGKNLLYLSDGVSLISQTEPKTYQKKELKDDLIGRTVAAIPSAANLPMSMMLRGVNPIGANSGIRWRSAQLESKNGVEGVVILGAAVGTQNSAAYRIYPDPKTHLVTRVEYSFERESKGEVPGATYSNVTTFLDNSVAITPASFQFVPGPDVQLAEAPTRPLTYDKTLVVGAKPFALTGKTLEGKPLSLDSYKGRVVLLDFWATWCGPCIGELPNVVSNYKTYHPQGLDIVGISLDEADDEQKLRDFVKTKEMSWAQIFDGKGWEAQDAATYGVRAIPFTLLIGKDGKIAAVNPRGESLEPAIKAALAK